MKIYIVIHEIEPRISNVIRCCDIVLESTDLIVYPITDTEHVIYLKNPNRTPIKFCPNCGATVEIYLVETKMVIVVRNDLNMRKGKLGAQCGHSIQYALMKRKDPMMRTWLADGLSTKIVVGCKDEAELNGLMEQAFNANIPVHKVVDVGKTEFKEPTTTCIAIGPAVCSEIDKITGHLKLL